jgi:hypothetical protein
MTTVCNIGTLTDADLSMFPEPMVRACGILRRIANCGQPFARMDGTLKIYLHLPEPADYPMQCATVRRDGSIQFTDVGSDRSTPVPATS